MTLQRITEPPGTKNIPKYARDKDRPYVGDPWSRQPAEPTRAYSAFLIYLELPPEDRTITAAMRIYRERNGLPSHPHPTTPWSSKHRWEERAQAHDNYLAAKKQAALKRRAIRAAEKHADMAADALMVAAAPSTKLAARMREQLEAKGMDFLDKLSDEDLMKLSRMFGDQMAGYAKMERESLSGAVDTTPAPQQLNAKAQKLRAIMGNREVMGLLEQVTVEVSELSDDEGSSTATAP